MDEGEDELECTDIEDDQNENGNSSNEGEDAPTKACFWYINTFPNKQTPNEPWWNLIPNAYNTEIHL